MRARELGRGSVVVGDRVALVGDLSGGAGSLARIVRIDHRTSVLRRTADDTDPVERAIVANADQLVVVDVPRRPGARHGVHRPLPGRRLRRRAGPAAVPHQGRPGRRRAAAGDVRRPRPARRDHPPRPGAGRLLRARLADRTSVLVGHSGVGKSTLVNAAGARRRARRRRGERGRQGPPHLVLGDRAAAARDGGWVVDTPGIRSFGLAHVRPADVLAAFPDMAAGAETCPPGCDHTATADRCSLDAWVAAGNAEPRRLASFRRLLDARSGEGHW